MIQTLLNWSWCFSDTGEVLAIGKRCPNSFPGRNTQRCVTYKWPKPGFLHTQTQNQQSLKQKKGWEFHQHLGQHTSVSSTSQCSGTAVIGITQRSPKGATSTGWLPEQRGCCFPAGMLLLPHLYPKPRLWGAAQPHHAQKQTHPVCRAEL